MDLNLHTFKGRRTPSSVNSRWRLQVSLPLNILLAESEHLHTASVKMDCSVLFDEGKSDALSNVLFI